MQTSLISFLSSKGFSFKQCDHIVIGGFCQNYSDIMSFTMCHTSAIIMS